MCEHVWDESVTTVLEGDRESLCGSEKVIIWCMVTIDCKLINSFKIYLDYQHLFIPN